MSSYGGSRHGSRDNLDQDAGSRYQPQAPPRAAPVPQSRDRSVSYDRQYVRNQPASEPESKGPPPSYRNYGEQSRAPVDRYGERPPPRSHSPRRYEEDRPQDQYYPSRSHSPSSYVARGESPARLDEPPRRPARDRSQSPGRALDPPGYQPSRGGYPASQSGYAPSQSGYAASQSGYAPSNGGRGDTGGYSQGQGYAPQGGYSPAQGYAPQGYNNRGRGQSTSSGYNQGGRPYAASQSSQYYQPRGPPKSYNGYQPFGGGRGYATRHTNPKHKSVTRDGGYYNVITDAVVKTKKMRTKGGISTFLAVTRPWSKNHSNQPRDFMPLVIASVFFNPPIGLIALVLSCITKKAVTEEDWAKAGLFGRVAFWMSIAAIISGIIFFAILIGSVHNDFVPPMLH